MDGQYPKRRHTPLLADPKPAVRPARELSDDELLEIARRREEFLAIMPEAGQAFFRDLYKEGVIEGWRSLLSINKIDPEEK
ncbi:hypothetical protein [Azonexus hydrophilus]|uniref:Uncharacterized protein n=1 Tax=Azonexus hydrophilus TaxID=418702 RepID=A0ABZ2XMY8_9RHOO